MLLSKLPSFRGFVHYFHMVEMKSETDLGSSPVARLRSHGSNSPSSFNLQKVPTVNVFILAIASFHPWVNRPHQKISTLYLK